MSQLLIRPFNALNAESPERLPGHQSIKTPQVRKARKRTNATADTDRRYPVPRVRSQHRTRPPLISQRASALFSRANSPVSLMSTMDFDYSDKRAANHAFVFRLSNVNSHSIFFAGWSPTAARNLTLQPQTTQVRYRTCSQTRSPLTPSAY